MEIKKIVAILAAVAVLSVAVFVGVVVMGDSQFGGTSGNEDAMATGTAGKSSADDGISFENISPSDVIIAVDTNNDGKFDSVEIQMNEATNQESSALTYNEYHSLSAEEQEAWLNEFESTEVFFEWYNGVESVEAANGESSIAEEGAVVNMGVSETDKVAR